MKKKTLTVQYITTESPLGKILLAEYEGKLVNLSFIKNRTDEEVLEYYRLSPGKRAWNDLLKKTKKELQEYFSGTRKHFSIPCRTEGSSFQEKAWKALNTIPFGKTKTYGQQAELLGGKKYSRAVGGANNKNPISIIVPCHRVIGSNGKMVGYGAGLERKEWLLDHEKQFS